jgi:hypothetical protein
MIKYLLLYLLLFFLPSLPQDYTDFEKRYVDFHERWEKGENFLLEELEEEFALPPLWGEKPPLRDTFPPLWGTQPPLREPFPPHWGETPPLREAIPQLWGDQPPLRDSLPPLWGEKPPQKALGKPL